MQHAILAGIGVITIRTAWGGLYLNFVKPGLRWWLILAGALVVAMGIYGMFTDDDRATKSGPEDGQTLDVHEAHHGSRIGWLLLVPFVVLSVLVPPPLGSFSAERDSGAVRSGAGQDTVLPPLPKNGGPVRMTLGDYSVRAVFDRGRTLQTQRVRLVGFVSSSEGASNGPKWFLTRMAMSCCAADGYAIKIDVRGGERLPDDTWVEATGHWVRSAGSPKDPGTLAALEIESLHTVAKPVEPYD